MINNSEIKTINAHSINYEMNEITVRPFAPESALDKYPKVYVVKAFNPFRIVYCGEVLYRDYIVYVEAGDGEKKILFTVNRHFKCCDCCEQCICGNFCCFYACCNSILYQLDYNRNGKTFLTHGFNITEGCHCCDLFILCTICDGPEKKLFLRENTKPDDPDITVGIQKGKTMTNCCCCFCTDKYAEYYDINNVKGPTVRAECCDICKNSCMNYCCCGSLVGGFDFEMSIEDEKGFKNGNIMVYSGCCSNKTEGECCKLPRAYYEVNFPPNATSEQKFQIIADLIHLDAVNNMIL